MTIGTAFSGRSGKPTTCTLRLVGRHHVALADSAVLQVQLQTGFKTDFAAFDSQYRLPRAVHRDQSSLIPLEPEAFIQKALALLASVRYLEKGMGLTALTGHRPAEISRAKFSLPKKRNSPSPPSSSRPAQNPPGST